MKLVLREYLASLRERSELDAILPDLLSQMGLNVISKPGIGTRQFGVDVAAVGSISEGRRLYLFSIKEGDLTRESWNGRSTQSLRPSLDEIRDSFITHRIPPQHSKLPITICICIGGDVRENVRGDLTGYLRNNTTTRLKFEEWNGDKLAELIADHFMTAELLPPDARSSLRKSLAMLDSPETSAHHFARLLTAIRPKSTQPRHRLTAARQIGICSWIVLGWSRAEGNLEAAYLVSELALLHAWELARPSPSRPRKDQQRLIVALWSTLHAYMQASQEFLRTDVLPLLKHNDALASSVSARSGIDVNLRLYELVGRLAVAGAWARWMAGTTSDSELQARCTNHLQLYSRAIVHAIAKNETLHLPALDEHAIEVTLAGMLMIEGGDRDSFRAWLMHIMERAAFTYKVDGAYPSIANDYAALLEHPKHDDDYRRQATAASVLYPLLAFWGDYLDDDLLFQKVADVTAEFLPHCSFQIWLPDSSTETHLYLNSGPHGITASDIALNVSRREFAQRVQDELAAQPEFNSLSAVTSGWWPIVFVACRRHRLPIPIHFLRAAP